jgi:transportin-1
VAPQFEALLGAVLAACLDPNRKVQEAACSALAVVIENTGAVAGGPALLPPRLPAIVQHLSLALTHYSRKNLRIAYDALASLAEAAGPALLAPELTSVFMPVLRTRLLNGDPQDAELLPLLEALTTLASKFGPKFEPYAKETYEKAIYVLSLHLGAKEAEAAGHPLPIAYDPQFVMCSLDLISGMCVGLGASIDALITGCAIPLVDLLRSCLADSEADVRQSAFALTGDLARCCVGHVLRILEPFLAAAVANLSPPLLAYDNRSACNNAAWSLGELAAAARPEQLAPHVPRLAEALVSLLQPAAPVVRSLRENASIALGRIAAACPELLAPHLDHFLGPWCSHLRNLRDDVEKEGAFTGLCRLIRLNPGAAAGAFPAVAVAAASWHAIKSEALSAELMQLLVGLKQHLAEGGRWDAAAAAIEPPVLQKLAAMGL